MLGIHRDVDSKTTGAIPSAEHVEGESSAQIHRKTKELFQFFASSLPRTAASSTTMRVPERTPSNTFMHEIFHCSLKFQKNTWMLRLQRETLSGTRNP